MQNLPLSERGKLLQKLISERIVYLDGGMGTLIQRCGLTDADDPNMEFRYCSKCNGYYCYCMKHINDHVHVQ